MPLPNCECIRGLPQADKLDAIYCALLQIAQGGGTIQPSQIEGITPFGIAALTSSPDPNQPLFWDGGSVVAGLSDTELAAFVEGAITINSSQIGDSSLFGRNVIVFNPTNSSPGPLVVGTSSDPSVVEGTTTGVASPPTGIQATSGVVVFLT